MLDFIVMQISGVTGNCEKGYSKWSATWNSFPGSLILPPPGGDPRIEVAGKGESWGRLP